jgi:hypothetical protein
LVKAIVLAMTVMRKGLIVNRTLMKKLSDLRLEEVSLPGDKVESKGIFYEKAVWTCPMYYGMTGRKELSVKAKTNGHRVQ